MPTEKQCGTASKANEAIGGVPAIWYFDFKSRGRAQVVRLMWEDAGIAYKDIRVTFDEYPDFKKGKLQEMNPLATVPVVEVGGRFLTQTYAMVRHFARQLGAYDGNTEEEKYWADAMCDVALDWRSKFADAVLGPNPDKDYPEHQKKTRGGFLKGLDKQLSSHSLSKSGPFVIGNTITYADLVIYQICHDENLTQDGRAGLNEYPRLTELVDAVEARPNVQAFLKSDRYKG